MSVISFPRHVEARPRPRTTVAPPRKTSGSEKRERVSHRRSVLSPWRNASATRKSALVLSSAIVIALAGSMFVANRQMEIHQLQSKLLQDQSTYAVQVGSLTNQSAPSQIATQAGALHLVEPVTVTQVPSTSLDVILPLPKFSGYAPVTSRTSR